MKLESAFLNVDPDEAIDLNKKKRMLRWDAKKRKFVKVIDGICAWFSGHDYVGNFSF